MEVDALQLNFIFIHQRATGPFDENGFVMSNNPGSRRTRLA